MTEQLVAAPPALVVVGHGTRDADGVEEFWALAQHVRDAAGDLPVEFGFIELAEPLVDEAIDKLVSAGAPRDVVSVPLVLLAAGHLKNDGPATLARARARHPGVRFTMGRDLGIDPVVLDVAEERIREAIGTDDPSQVGVVLVGRGSSDPDATSDLFKVARLLQDGRGLGWVEPAFAGVAQPDVAGACERLRLLGARTVVVAPLLLFTGVLVPRIYERAAEWGRRHPEVEVRGAGHLGPDRRLAKLVLERYREALQGDVRMNCDLCAYRVRLPGYEDKVGTPISLTPHGDGPARGKRRGRRATRAPQPAPAIEVVPRKGLRPVAVTVDAGAPPALDVRDLRYAYPDGSEALSGVSLSVQPGERVAVLGPNGAGKTTLVLRLNGTIEDGEGEVVVGGVRLEKATRKEVRRRVGIVFQDSDDQLFMPTVEADVAFGPANLGLRGDALAERVDEALAQVGLDDDVRRKAPHQLSAGQRRRAAVAGVLAMRPDVLVLDEPSSALDPAARRELADVLQSLRLTTLLVTHDLPYALELCPRAVVLDRGQVVADGPTREVLADEGFMRAHRLELPAGFNPLSA
nr:CbiX/SirB N-terminal domain-containing protein [Conexibacter sp. SYSU D00693]